MASELGKATVEIVGDLTPLQASMKAAKRATLTASKSMARALRRTVGSAAKATARTIGRAFKSAFKGAVRTIKTMAKVIIASLIGIGIASVKMASDARESENLFEEAMGGMAGAARNWSEAVSTAVGINAFELRKQIGTLNLMLKSMGLTEEAAYNMARDLTLLTQDMASFRNLKPEEAFQKLQAGITGETEPLKRLGILINDDFLKTKALTEGIIKEGESLTQLQKIQLRYTAIMEQTQKDQGDMVRTQHETANVFRRLKSTVKDVMITFGTGLLPAVTKAGSALQKWFADNKDKFKVWGEKVGDALEIAWGWVADLWHLIATNDWEGALSKIGVAFKKAFKITFEFLKPHAIGLGEAIADGVWKGIKAGAKAAATGAVKLIPSGMVGETFSKEQLKTFSERGVLPRDVEALEQAQTTSITSGAATVEPVINLLNKGRLVIAIEALNKLVQKNNQVGAIKGQSGSGGT